jgi:DNA-binding winged helix-turn-helix (wHTH) protein
MRLQLGGLVLDLDTRQLLRGRTEIHLSPKAFDLLTILTASRPRALSKSELHRQLWPDTFVSDVNLATLIAEIRKALGDDARRPRYIRTAHRFGYAFCGTIRDTPQAATPEIFCWLVRDGRRLPLHGGENILGRDAVDGIALDSPTVSRRHARITIAASVATIEDLRSKNGTFVGDTPVSEPVPLSDGDEIRTGSVVLHFRMTRPRSATATWSGRGRRS